MDNETISIQPMISAVHASPSPPPLLLTTPPENIQVCFRVRPSDRREVECQDEYGWNVDTETNTLIRRADTVGMHTTSKNSAPQMRFQCEKLFDQHSSTQQLYEQQVRDIVDSAMRGVNGTIFAYG
jgi:centromeric protein E